MAEEEYENSVWSYPDRMGHMSARGLGLLVAGLAPGFNPQAPIPPRQVRPACSPG